MARVVKYVLIVFVVAFATLIAVRAWDSLRGAPLEPWHTFVPHELSVSELDAGDWAQYIAAENRIYEAMRNEVTRVLPERDRVPTDRYFEASPIYPGHFKQDWNRSFILEPQGEPAGAVVLLHGLTDSPYSLRKVAELYRAHGYAAVGLRIPGHGTVPGALTQSEWEDWMAATRLAVREARQIAGKSKPLQIVGYSNGGALALKYALDALDDDKLEKADRVVLISPMIGITAFARFVGLAAIPAYFPGFAKAAWLSVLPEFNPFKYNSFPVNAAWQSHRLTQALQEQIAAAQRSGKLANLPPVLTFQSVVDETVSTAAVVSEFYARLPPKIGELVLFDINRTTPLVALVRPSVETTIARLLPSTPRNFRTTIITNDGTTEGEEVESVVEAGASTATTRPLGLTYPAESYSLSHVALPFPINDGLYGLHPDADDDFGIRLGSLAPRGERGVLIVGLDTVVRMTSNPFYPYLAKRIEEGLPR